MLPYVTLTLHLEQNEMLRLPEHAGSMLRGAFGNALRKLSCITRQKECKACPLIHSCPYPQTFESGLLVSATAVNDSPQPVNPYVINPPAMGQKCLLPGTLWNFEFSVFGRAMHLLPLLVYAWQQAASAGFGKSRSKASLQQITQGCTVVYQQGGSLTAFPQVLEIPRLSDQVRLLFHTPVRFQHQGHVVLVRDQLSAEIILMTLAHRIHALMSHYGIQPVQLDLERLREKSRLVSIQTVGLHRQQVQRFSSRQQHLITLDGLIGEVQLKGDLQPFEELLALGQYTHLGKNATHGLGKYHLVA